jgi:uncharacterized protein
MHQGRVRALGNNQMLACDPRSGEVRRFLTGPVGCEITGAPGRPTAARCSSTCSTRAKRPARSDPAEPRRFSNWPDFPPDGRPRSATVVIRKRTAA